MSVLLSDVVTFRDTSRSIWTYDERMWFVVRQAVKVSFPCRVGGFLHICAHVH